MLQGNQLRLANTAANWVPLTLPADQHAWNPPPSMFTINVWNWTNQNLFSLDLNHKNYSSLLISLRKTITDLWPFSPQMSFMVTGSTEMPRTFWRKYSMQPLPIITRSEVLVQNLMWSRITARWISLPVLGVWFDDGSAYSGQQCFAL